MSSSKDQAALYTGIFTTLPTLDITCDTIRRPDLSAEVEVHVRADGKVLWINFGPKCVVRICGLTKVDIADNRKS